MRRQCDQNWTFAIDVANEKTGALRRRSASGSRLEEFYDVGPPSTVTARRFCDQQEMSLQTATGRSLP